jgi:hypothetical protein
MEAYLPDTLLIALEPMLKLVVRLGPSLALYHLVSAPAGFYFAIGTMFALTLKKRI